VVRRPAVLAIAAVVFLVVAYVPWWPSLPYAVQGIHGPLGGGPAMHGMR
jgi:hypothetical protein